MDPTEPGSDPDDVGQINNGNDESQTGSNVGDREHQDHAQEIPAASLEGTDQDATETPRPSLLLRQVSSLGSSLSHSLASKFSATPRASAHVDGKDGDPSLPSTRQSQKWGLHGGFSSLSSKGFRKSRRGDLIFEDIGEEPAPAVIEEETEEEIAARKLKQKLNQAKKLEKFFLKTDIPPRPVLERTKYGDRGWKFDINHDWLGRSSQWNFFKLKSPFLASFHLAWFSFFCCFMGWFAIGPLVPLMLRSGFTKEDIEKSNALALASTIIIRFVLGPFCEAYGPRLIMTATLAIGGFLVCSTAAVTSGSGLMASRFFIGLIGGAFVPCQFWITMMFSTKIVGFMSGAAGGFGNAGAGVIVFVMAGLIAAFQNAGYTDDKTWRYSLLVPGLLMIACAIPTWFIPSDCPQGAWRDRKYGTPADKVGRMTWLHRGGSKLMRQVLKVEQCINRTEWLLLKVYYRIKLFFMTEERLMAFWDWRAWMVGIQYAIASGVELSILTGLTAYYVYEFGCDNDTEKQLQAKELILQNTSIHESDTCLALSTVAAANISAIFGLTNIYGRMLGGGLSDYIANSKTIFHGARGRHLATFITLFAQGGLMVAWCQILDWRASAGFLVLFSSVVHCAKGAVIAITPSVRPGCVGPVMGVVSAVGNLGGVLMSLMYSAFPTSRETYFWQGIICMVGSVTAFTLKVYDLERRRDVWLTSHPPTKDEELDDGEEEDDEPKRRRRLSIGPGSTVRGIWEARFRSSARFQEDGDVHALPSVPEFVGDDEEFSSENGHHQRGAHEIFAGLVNGDLDVLQDVQRTNGQIHPSSAMLRDENQVSKSTTDLMII